VVGKECSGTDLKVSQNSILPVCDILWVALAATGAAPGVNLLHADHFTLSDAGWLFDELPGLWAEAPAVPLGTSISTIRNDIAAFLDTYLLARSGHAFYGQPSRGMH